MKKLNLVFSGILLSIFGFINSIAAANIILPEFKSIENLAFKDSACEIIQSCDLEEWNDEFEYESQPLTPDPFEIINRTVFNFNHFLYTRVIIYISDTYKNVLPYPVRDGITNFFENIKYPIRLVNSAIQLKGEKVVLETQKFAINTTFGILGLKNLAQTQWGINPSGEDLGQTLGHYGIGHGFYIVLPLIGPTSMRDLVGRVGDGFLSPLNQLPEQDLRIGSNGLETINDWPPTMDLYFNLTAEAFDSYSSIKDGYAQIRANKVSH